MTRARGARRWIAAIARLAAAGLVGWLLWMLVDGTQSERVGTVVGLVVAGCWWLVVMANPRPANRRPNAGFRLLVLSAAAVGAVVASVWSETAWVAVNVAITANLAAFAVPTLERRVFGPNL